MGSFPRPKKTSSSFPEWDERPQTSFAGLIPARDRAVLAHRLIEHGRKICTARRARCGECVLADLCPKIGVAEMLPV